MEIFVATQAVDTAGREPTVSPTLAGQPSPCGVA